MKSRQELWQELREQLKRGEERPSPFANPVVWFAIAGIAIALAVVLR